MENLKPETPVYEYGPTYYAHFYLYATPIMVTLFYCVDVCDIV